MVLISIYLLTFGLNMNSFPENNPFFLPSFHSSKRAYKYNLKNVTTSKGSLISICWTRLFLWSTEIRFFCKNFKIIIVWRHMNSKDFSKDTFKNMHTILYFCSVPMEALPFYRSETLYPDVSKLSTVTQFVKGRTRSQNWVSWFQIQCSYNNVSKFYICKPIMN